jgi:hypothetical protein
MKTKIKERQKYKRGKKEIMRQKEIVRKRKS